MDKEGMEINRMYEDQSKKDRSKESYILKMITILLILGATIGFIAFVQLYYIPNSFDEGYLEGVNDTLNNSEIYMPYYNYGYNYGYLIGQEEIIIKINQNGTIPVVNTQDMSVEWYPLDMVCEYIK